MCTFLVNFSNFFIMVRVMLNKHTGHAKQYIKQKNTLDGTPVHHKAPTKIYTSRDNLENPSHVFDPDGQEGYSLCHLHLDHLDCSTHIPTSIES